MSIDPAFQWRCHGAAARLVNRWVHELVAGVPFLAKLESRMLTETGTRLIDWIDHLAMPLSQAASLQLEEAGFVQLKTAPNSLTQDAPQVWKHVGGMFPRIVEADQGQPRLTIEVESVVDFLAAHQCHAEIQGQPGSPLRMATVATTSKGQFGIVERHGNRSFAPQPQPCEKIVAAQHHGERFRTRERDSPREQDGFECASELFREAAQDLGVDWACDLFFAAERSYWQSRNLAARIQKARQDRLGLGWANHDHHTYRSSRQHFAALVALLEQMGFQCRERFYGGAEAGWGAQVLEQPCAGIVIFADVDLSPQEVTGDFAHQGLTPCSQLGTIGLWCGLHGEAMLQAGMHHLECQFDFEDARSQLADDGIVSMPPFTDFPYLRQAFTEGEIWSVKEQRVDRLASQGSISPAQVEQFRRNGCIGSHLEILQREDGYKGFNQTGISEIIRNTDPRQAR